MAKRYDIVIPKKYEKNGEEKTSWKNVGTLVRFDATQDKPESFLLELHMFPTTTFKVFEHKDRDEQPQERSQASAPAEDMERDINPDDIPF